MSVIISTTWVAAEEPKIDLQTLDYEASRTSYSSTAQTTIGWLFEELLDTTLSIDPLMKMLAGELMINGIRP